MVEYDTWIRQEKEYKNILDQLKISFVQAALNRLEVAKSKTISEWEQCVTSLTKEYEISKENSQHLSLIIEYLKVRLTLNFKHRGRKWVSLKLYRTTKDMDLNLLRLMSLSSHNKLLLKILLENPSPG